MERCDKRTRDRGRVRGRHGRLPLLRATHGRRRMPLVDTPVSLLHRHDLGQGLGQSRDVVVVTRKRPVPDDP